MAKELIFKDDWAMLEWNALHTEKLAEDVNADHWQESYACEFLGECVLPTICMREDLDLAIELVLEFCEMAELWGRLSAPNWPEWI